MTYAVARIGGAFPRPVDNDELWQTLVGAPT